MNEELQDEPIQNDSSFDSEVFEDVDPIEPTQEEPELQEEPVETEEPTEVDNPKSYKHFQSLAEQRKVENERLAQQLQDLQSKVEALNKPQEQPVNELVPPTPPEMPLNYSEVDARTDFESDSYKYLLAKEKYNSDLIQYQNKLIEKTNQRFEQAENEKIQAQQFAQQKASIIGEFQNNGLSLQEAADAFEMFTSEDSVKPSNLAKYYKWLKGQQAPPTREKPNAVPPPPGVVPGNTEPQKTPDQLFNEDIEKQPQGKWL